MDASTNFRAHPLELMFWFGTSNIIAAAIFGLDLLSLGLYFLVATPFFFLEHANLRFPTWIDKTFGLVFTTPNLHKIHHEQDQYFTDSNFADIFILWDRFFGTYKYKPAHEIKFGLKEFDDDKKQTFWYLFRSPFININRITSGELRKDKQNL
jgi:sterol desaturase/sphingolipid hydroxylase (fatty acid hydroxylase superfamily)